MNLYIYSDESGVFDYVHRVILSIISSEKFQKNVAKMVLSVYNNSNGTRRASGAFLASCVTWRVFCFFNDKVIMFYRYQ